MPSSDFEPWIGGGASLDVEPSSTPGRKVKSSVNTQSGGSHPLTKAMIRAQCEFVPWVVSDPLPGKLKSGTKRNVISAPQSHAKKQKMDTENGADVDPGRCRSGLKRCVVSGPRSSAKKQKGETVATPRSLSLGANTPSLLTVAAGGTTRKTTVHTDLGADPTHIKNRLKAASCACKDRPCHKAVSLKSLIATCAVFWSISSAERGMMLRHEYHAAQEKSKEEDHDEDEYREDADEGQSLQRMRRVTWHLCGVPVCFPMFCHLLRTGDKFVRRSIHGQPDWKSNKLQGEDMSLQRRAPQTALCDWFFQELYQSAAEPLPEDLTCAAQFQPELHKAQDDFEGWYDKPKPLPASKLPPGCATSKQQNVTFANGGCAAVQLSDSLNLSPAVALTVACSTQVLGLPTRYFQYCRLSDLYWQFLSASDLHQANHNMFDKTPSFATFSRCWFDKWRKVLHPRKASQHAQCQTCWQLQQTFRSRTVSWGEKLQAARDLRAHYRLQYEDRCLYWSLRWASRLGTDILVIIIDSMDKTKFAWPKWPFRRIPKNLETVHRPRLCLNAVMAHGYCTSLYLADDKLFHGGDTWCEMICRTLDSVKKICDERKQPFPKHLVIQADNTTGQCKNQYGTGFLCFLVASYKFLTADLNFLMVGHTHEDVDQLFAVVLWFMVQMGHFLTPEHLLDNLAKRMRPKVQDKGESLICEHLTAIRSFSKWLEPMGLKLSGAFKTRQGVETPHAFSFKLGVLLTASEKTMLQECQLPIEDDAVYCCVKTYMRDTHLQQEPLHCVKAAQARRVWALSPAPTAIVPRGQRSEEEIKNITVLADACKHELGLPDAGAALEALLTDRRVFLPRLTWLETFTRDNVVETLRPRLRNPYFPHLPEVSWRLVAEVKRSARG